MVIYIHHVLYHISSPKSQKDFFVTPISLSPEAPEGSHWQGSLQSHQPWSSFKNLRKKVLLRVLSDKGSLMIGFFIGSSLIGSFFRVFIDKTFFRVLSDRIFIRIFNDKILVNILSDRVLLRFDRYRVRFEVFSDSLFFKVLSDKLPSWVHFFRILSKNRATTYFN